MRATASPRRYKGVRETKGIISVPLYWRQFCRRIVAEAKKSSWHSAEVHPEEEGITSAVYDEQRSAESFVPALDSDLRRDFDERVNNIVRPLIKEAWRSDFRGHRDMHLVRYSPGGFYVPHIDIVPGAHHRYFTVLCYLNDEFSGGSTTFPLLNFSVKPETGKAIIFPATYLHSAEPVTRGEKYVLVSWLTGTPPISWL